MMSASRRRQSILRPGYRRCRKDMPCKQFEIGNLSQKVDDYEIEWTIEHILLYKTEDESYCSPQFSLSGSKWYFEIFPNGETCNDTVGYISLYLHRVKDICSGKSVNFTISLKAGISSKIVNNENWEFNQNSYKCGVPKFVKKLELKKFSEVTFMLKKNDSSDNISDKELCGTASCFDALTCKLGRMLDAGSYYDVELKCGDVTMKAHRSILCARSEVFHAMLNSNMKETESGIVEIQDMEANIFKMFVRYLYTSKLPEISPDDAVGLIEAGDKYAVEELKDACSDVLMKDLTKEIACRVLHLADTYNDQRLKEKVITFIIEQDIPLDDSLWLPFSSSHPKLAVDVLNQAYKSVSKVSRKRKHSEFDDKISVSSMSVHYSSSSSYDFDD